MKNMLKNYGIKTMLSLKRLLLFFVLLVTFTYYTNAQTSKDTTIVISAKNLYKELKNKSLKFSYNQEIIITGVLKETGSSFIYNSSYLLISDKNDGYIYVKAVLADKKKKDEYKKGQTIKIHCRFYEERSNVIVVKDAKNQ